MVVKKKEDKFKIALMDEACIMGVGSIDLKTDTTFVKVDIELLKRAIKVVENVTCKNGKGVRDSICIGLKKNEFPLMIGELHQDKKYFSGVLIAPRVDNYVIK